tara:strand:- start:43 stop:672 length:630 start_codon:yes stop_codon:yes gene_type:complete
MIGVYTFVYKNMDNKVCCKVGKDGSKKQRRIDQHLTSCAGLSEGPFFPCSEKELNTLERTMLDLMRENFESIRDETFILGDNLTLDESIDVLKSILTPDILETIRTTRRTNHKNIDYTVNTLYGEQDIRDLRPKSDFLIGEDAMIQTEAGVGEDYRKVWTWMNKQMQKLETPEHWHIDDKSWKTWVMARHSLRMELERAQIDKHGEGKL